MSDISWIKIRIDMFDDEKIKIIQNMPEGDALIVIWVRLMLLAGKTSDSGYVYMNEFLPYTEEMLSVIFNKKQSVINMALSLFEQLQMIERDAKGIVLVNFEKHQNLAKMEAVKEYNREKKRLERAKRKAELENRSQNLSLTCQECQDTDKELDKELDKDKKNNETKVSKEFIQSIIDSWNSLSLSKLTKIAKGSARYKSINARVMEYGEDSFLQAINLIKESDFLKGVNDKGWVITFDWFIKPNNFVKVLEGNYTTRKKVCVIGIDEQHSTKQEDDVERALRKQGKSLADLREDTDIDF